MDLIKCENCDESMCEYDMFSCECKNVNFSDKCKVCQSSGYDCEVDGVFEIKCPNK